MKYYNFLNEDVISKALNLPEPKIGGDYASEKVKRYIKMIEAALSAMKKKEENDANDAIVQDLRNKKKAWQNVDKETKPVKTKTEVPPDQEEQPPEEAPPKEEPASAPQEQPPPQEGIKKGRFMEFLGGTLDG